MSGTSPDAIATAVVSPVGWTMGWTVAELSVVPHGDDFLVGDASTGVFVVLPSIGVDVLAWLRAGRSMTAIAALAGDRAGQDVDVIAFVDALQSLGFLRMLDDGEIDDGQIDRDDSIPSSGEITGRAALVARSLDRAARAVFGRVGWSAFALAAIFCATAFCARPALVPRSGDIFFLSTPALSLAALTVMTYLLAAAHEGAHWLAARAEGVKASVTVSRRLYFLVLETDLTGLWSIPRHRRWRPILAGMAFDTAVLAVVLAVRMEESSARPAAIDSVLAALTVVLVAGLAAQFMLFMQTDIYALLVTITGTVNLQRTTALSLLSMAHLATGQQLEELARCARRDIRVARWYRWIWLGGMAAATWFFVSVFAPTTIQTIGWVGAALWPTHPTSAAFWEAVVLSVVVTSPIVITAAVMVRDLWPVHGVRAD